MSRIDVMVDIETLGLRSKSPIIQIGAVVFDIYDGSTHDAFDGYASDVSGIDPKTLDWWASTDNDLLSMIMEKGKGGTEDGLIKHFNDWLLNLTDDTRKIHLWGNGILFDNYFLRDKFEYNGLVYPIAYDKDRDMRTIVDLAGYCLDTSKEDLIRSTYDNSRKHDALNDAYNQSKLVSYCYNEIKAT